MQSNYQLMVDLDAIIDSRIAVVSLLDPQFSCALVEKNYKQRQTDWFVNNAPNYTAEQYRERYAKRDHQVLEAGSLTPILDYICEMILSQIKEQVSPLVEQTYRIFLNTSPYNLNEDEKAELVKCLAVYVPMATEYTIVTIPRQWLTPGYFLTNSISAYITYDAVEWLQQYVKELEKSPMAGFHLIGPELLESPPDITALSEEEKEAYETVGPFRAFEMSAMPYASVRLIPAMAFSSLFTA